MRTVVVCPTYNGVDRLTYELDTLRRYDPLAFNTPILIVEDPCGFVGVSKGYHSLTDDFPVKVIHLEEWSNMHGAARKAFDAAMELYDPEWIIYMGDDLAFTEGSLTNMIKFVTRNELKTVALVQFPYWNAHDISENQHGDWKGPQILKAKEDFYKSMDWIERVPRNPHWEGEGYSVPYINVNGAGFACRASMYRDVGGFAEGTWCLDESIAHKMWLQTEYACITLPGPPIVHYFGASTCANPPKHDMHTEERWIEAMGMNKQESGLRIREKMAERWDRVVEETKRCLYD